MYETYSGVRNGLIASDVANLQSLYGVRTKDLSDKGNGNNALWSATDLKRPSGSDANASIVVAADITTGMVVDCYRVQTLNANPDGMTVRLDAGRGVGVARQQLPPEIRRRAAEPGVRLGRDHHPHGVALTYRRRHTTSTGDASGSVEKNRSSA